MQIPITPGITLTMGQNATDLGAGGVTHEGTPSSREATQVNPRPASSIGQGGSNTAPAAAGTFPEAQAYAAKLAEDERQTQDAIEKLKIKRNGILLKLAKLDSLISGAEGRLLQLRGNQLLKQRERLVEQRHPHAQAMAAGLDAVEKALQPRAKMTAAEHNAYPNGRFA